MSRSFWKLTAITLTAMLWCGGAPIAQAKSPQAKKGGSMIVCPVTGEKVAKSKAIPMVHKGKQYYLCCRMCVKPFKKHPGKYLAKAAKYADPVKPAAAQHAVYTCPMHPEVVSHKPGDCPQCGMRLELRANQKR